MLSTARPTASSPRRPRLGFIGGFDGIRGVGVFDRAVRAHLPGGDRLFSPIVDIFFVISAFLIVSLLMQERRQNGNIDLKRFYTRRALRLLPTVRVHARPGWCCTGCVKVSGIDSPRMRLDQVNSIPLQVAGSGDVRVPPRVPDRRHVAAHLVQFWSLSVEEQFYLVVGFASVVVLARSDVSGSRAA